MSRKLLLTSLSKPNVQLTPHCGPPSDPPLLGYTRIVITSADAAEDLWAALLSSTHRSACTCVIGQRACKRGPVLHL